jgi:hypothetical protein
LRSKGLKDPFAQPPSILTIALVATSSQN